MQQEADYKIISKLNSEILTPGFSFVLRLAVGSRWLLARPAGGEGSGCLGVSEFRTLGLGFYGFDLQGSAVRQGWNQRPQRFSWGWGLGDIAPPHGKCSSRKILLESSGIQCRVGMPSRVEETSLVLFRILVVLEFRLCSKVELFVQSTWKLFAF